MITLAEELRQLEAEQNAKTEIVDYREKLTVLRYALEQYTNPQEGDVPESVIEAFVVKIVVSQNGFDWYLRFDNDPLHHGGKRENNHQNVRNTDRFPDQRSQRHRPPSRANLKSAGRTYVLYRGG